MFRAYYVSRNLDHFSVFKIMLQGHFQERSNCPRSNSGECELIPVLTRFLGDWTILWIKHHRWLAGTFELLCQVKPSRAGWFLRGQQCWEFTWGIWCLGRSAEGYSVPAYVCGCRRFLPTPVLQWIVVLLVQISLESIL